jgi:predicted cupin superfamily sugar epimerase
MTRDAGYWIEKLDLARHPEGGFYRETYRSTETIPMSALPCKYDGARPFSTAIYFLLCGEEFSAFHRIKSDELWHFYCGASLTIHLIDHAGAYSEIMLGSDYGKGESFQAVVKAGCWFGASLSDPHSYALVGCTVAPGFDYRDFEMANRKELIRRYPEHVEIIARLTHFVPEES